MKVFFGTSTSQFFKYSKYYLSIRDFIIEEGHVITRDWVGENKEMLIKPKKLNLYNEFKDNQWYEKAIMAVKSAEALILEDTVSSFSNGHILTIAVQRKIPVLALRIKGEKMGGFSNSFISGIKSDYLEIKEYNLDDYKEVIKSFLNKFENSKKRYRFHLVIDEVEKRYLDFAKHTTKNSRTNLIRKAIRESLKKDKDYENYLKR